MKDEGIVVGQDVQIVDKLGRSHQVDVYYQFEKAGITHKVAIECKDHGRPVDNGHVAKFFGKLANAGNIQKVMVSRLGYQKLAYEIAEDNDVMLLTVDDLPRFNELLAERLKAVALPDESTVGEPFWTIMEKEMVGLLVVSLLIRTQQLIGLKCCFFTQNNMPNGLLKKRNLALINGALEVCLNMFSGLSYCN